MKLESLTLNNFLGVPSLRLDLTPPLVVVAGPNGIGKSSLHDGISFALYGGLPRGLTLVGERQELVYDGAKSGFVEIEVNGHAVRRDVASAKLGAAAVPDLPGALPYALEAHRFLRLDELARRRFLAELMRVDSKPSTIVAQLTQAGCDLVCIEEVAPHLAGGFDAAAKYATDKAAEARAAWRYETGEAYGSKKAEGWKADAGDLVSVEEITAITDKIERADAGLVDLNQRLGAAKSRPTPEAIAAKRAEADGLADLVAREGRGQTALDALDKEIATLAALAGANAGTQQPCPCCNAMLVLNAGRLSKFVESEVAPAEAFAQHAAKVEERERVMNGLAQVRSQIRRANDAKTWLEAVQGENVTTPAESVKELEEALHEAKAQRQLLVDYKTTQLDAQRKAEEAAAKTERAAQAHRRALAWAAVAEQLAPDGLPASLLAQAIAPINRRIAESCAATGWGPVEIGRDMGVRYAGRRLSLASESEQWRAGAFIAEAIAHLAGARVLLLDRFDVLDPKNRAPAMRWLLGLAQAYDNIIVTASLKEPPTIPGASVVWLDEVVTGRRAA